MKALLIAGLLTIFGAQNWDNVPLLLFFGPPTHIRLIFLLTIAAGVGYMTALIKSARHEVKLMRENRQLREQLRPFLTPAKRPVATEPAARRNGNFLLEEGE
jgi:uncharacterized integral membrane protein